VVEVLFAYNNEGHLLARMRFTPQMYRWWLTHLDIVAILISDHNLDNEVVCVRWNGLLADMLYQATELHGHSLFVLTGDKLAYLLSKHTTARPFSCR